MDSLILHHYPTSPFAEKIRLVLGYKSVPWTSVMIPPVMPKPDVIALTGGYRKTPILQIGADIYCDTALIVRVIERHQPQPALFPPGEAGVATILSQWADTTLFWTAIPYALQPAGAPHVLSNLSPEQLQVFRTDRAAFRAKVPVMRGPEANAVFKAYLSSIEALLVDGRPWLCGPTPSIADFSVYHCLWFAHRSGPLAAVFDATPQIRRWYDAMTAFGHGHPESLDSAEAVQLAARSTPRAIGAPLLQDAGDMVLGERVTMTPTDYGCDPVEGELLSCSANEVALRRHDERAGDVVVHFPRIGFELRRVG